MTTHSTSISNAAGLSTPRSPRSGQGLLAGIAAFWREFLQTAFVPYHPERHYMRGPGPACAKRKQQGV